MRRPRAAVPAKPLISVVMTCYNHRRYIEEAVDSVLTQSHENLELILVDDGSSDGTSTLIHAIRDKRLTYVWQENAGPSLATNRGIRAAKGEFIALMGGDDVCMKDRLAIQRDQVGMGHDAVFSMPLLIDDASASLPYYRYPPFYQANFAGSPDLFRRLFFEFNFLCGPTAFLRRDFFDRIGVYKAGLIQLQDFDLWIRGCRGGARLARFEEPLLKYRIRKDDANLSSNRFSRRTTLEMRSVFADFFAGADLPFLRLAFPREVNLLATSRDLSVEADLLMLKLAHPSNLVRSVGVEEAIAAFDRDEDRAELAARGLTPREFFRLSSEIQPYVI